MLICHVISVIKKKKAVWAAMLSTLEIHGRWYSEDKICYHSVRTVLRTNDMSKNYVSHSINTPQPCVKGRDMNQLLVVSKKKNKQKKK